MHRKYNKRKNEFFENILSFSLRMRPSWVLFLFYAFASGQDIFTCTTYIPALGRVEKHLMSVVKGYLERAQERLNLMKSLVENYDSQLSSFMKDNDLAEHWNNPLSSYHLLKRTTVDIEDIANLLNDTSAIELLDSLESLRKRNELPKLDDLHGAALGLIRLQKTYHLNVTAMAGGLIQSTASPSVVAIPIIDTHFELTARDCLFLARHSMKEQLYLEAVEWLEQALLRNNPEFGATVEEIHIKQHLYEAREMAEEQRVASFSKVGQKEAFIPTLYEETLTWELEQEQYRRLCRGEQLRPPAWDKDLHCHYSKGHHPFYTLQPLKVEVMLWNPYLIIFYDIISDRQINLLKELAKPRLQRSAHLGDSGSLEVSVHRTSANAWILDSDDPEIKKISKRLEMITGLAADHDKGDAEWYQVVNYGIGGHYVPHQDYLQVPTLNSSQAIDSSEERKGDRIATLMFYLSDVEAGGATAFTHAGVSIWPKKGSAAFWWNLDASGKGHPMTRHGGCPVLYGSKWVANKWFRSNSQLSRRPCKTNPNDLLGPLK